MRLLKLIALCCSAAILSGCATTAADCDPSNRDASLWTKMNCDGSGQYRGHVDRAEKELVSAQEEHARFQQIYADIEAQRQAVGKNLAEQRKKQQALNRSLGSLLADLKKRHADKQDVARQISALEANLQATNTLATNPDAIRAKQKQLQDLQAKAQKLKKSLEQ